METMSIWNDLKAVPGQAKKKITGGRLRGMTDIKPQWRLQMMTEKFGAIGIGWYYKTIRTWTEEANTEISAHVEVELFIKVDNEWSMPISGIGGSMLLTKESKGLYHSDEAYKMATTDALSVAMKQLGVAADVYMGLSDSKYDKHTEVKQMTPESLKMADSSQRKTMEAYLKKFTEQGDVKAIDYISESLSNPSLTHEQAKTIILHSKAKVG